MRMQSKIEGPFHRNEVTLKCVSSIHLFSGAERDYVCERPLQQVD